MKVYINGKFYEKKDARISVFDHGLLYGDGVFEGAHDGDAGRGRLGAECGNVGSESLGRAGPGAVD